LNAREFIDMSLPGAAVTSLNSGNRPLVSSPYVVFAFGSEQIFQSCASIVGVRIADPASLGWTLCESSRDRPTARRAALAIAAPPAAAFRVRVMQQFPPRLASLRHRKRQVAVFSRTSRARYFYKPKHTTTRLRMAHATCPESQSSQTCSKLDAPPAKASRATTPQTVAARRHKTHPVTWVVTAAIIPLLCWDAWQTFKEAKLSKMPVDAKFARVAGESGHPPRLDEPLPDHVPVVRARIDKTTPAAIPAQTAK
jgi:hypothetical protein